MNAYGTQQGQPGQLIPGNTAGVFPGDTSVNGGTAGGPGTVNIGGNTVDTGGASPVDVASAQLLAQAVSLLGKLVARLAPPRVLEQKRFFNVVANTPIDTLIMSGVKFNGILFTITTGTLFIYLGEGVDVNAAGIPINPPDIALVGGTSTGYIPMPSDTDLVLTFFSMDAANDLFGTVSFLSY